MNKKKGGKPVAQEAEKDQGFRSQEKSQHRVIEKNLVV